MYYHDKINHIFFPERLLASLSDISIYDITITEAPRNFGKSTALRHYFLHSEYNIKLEACVDISQPVQFYKTIISLLIPHSLNKYDINNCNCENELLRIFSLMSFPKKVLLYINNVHYFTYNTLNIIIRCLLKNLPRGLNIILEIRSSLFEKPKFKKYAKTINYIGYNEFLLSTSDIKIYFSLHSIELSLKDAEMLFKTTNGWLPSVRLHLNRLLLLKEFSKNFSSDRINEFLYSNNSELTIFNLKSPSFSRDKKMKDFFDCFMENQLFINDVITKLIDIRTNNESLNSSD
ncbi:MAG: hypothetical protein IJ736_16095, partial [Firmicutes bacterium]|nr:hypothetical protein [Bacillota bacterium]